MATKRPYADATVAPATAATRPGLGISHLDWGAIIAGAVLAAAISLVLLSFGAAIGLSVASPYPGEGASSTGFLIGVALWMIWVVVSSFMAGGYLTGRMRRTVGDSTPHEIEVRDGAHGLMVWALGVLIAAVLGVSGVAGIIGVGASAGSAALSAAGSQPYGDTGPIGMAVDALFRPAGPAPAAAAAGCTPAQGGGTAPSAPAGGAAPSATTPAQGAGPAGAPDVAQTREAKQEVGRILTADTLRGDLPAGDRSYVARLVAQRTGLSPAEADRRVTQVLAEARHKADQARQAGVIGGFLAAATLLVAAAGAWWAAGNGGRHRDENTVFAGFFRRRV